MICQTGHSVSVIYVVLDIFTTTNKYFEGVQKYIKVIRN